VPDYGVNWDKIHKRHSAFWQGELKGSCLFAVTAPRTGHSRRQLPYPTDTEGRIKWRTDPKEVIARHRDGFQGTYFAGDAFPVLTHDLGAAGHAGFFKGAQPRFEDSIWFEPSLKSYDDLAFDPDSFLYKKTIDMAKAYADDAKGDYVIGMPDAVGAADALSHLRGPQQFMMDMYDQPKAVKAALKKVQAVWENTMTSAWDAVCGSNKGYGCVGWLGTLAPGFHVQLQCDCSVMLSADMFEEFLCYELDAQSQFVDYSLYHLDGEEQVRHLPYLLAVDGIHAIQWTNIAGQAPPTAYIPVLKQIQKAGKRLILGCMPKEVPLLLENLDQRLLYLGTRADSETEADDLVELAQRMFK